MAERIHRVAARVLPVSRDGSVLLLQERDPARPGDRYWMSIGGAVDPGDTHQQAAVREMREETGIGISVDDLVGPIHQGTRPFSWNGVDYLGHATVFAVPLDRAVEVTFDGLEPAEVGSVLRAEWWTPAALRADGTSAWDDLPDIMETAIDVVRRGEK